MLYHKNVISLRYKIIQTIDMNWRELEKRACERGFVFVKHRKKHDELYNPKSGVTILIERHWSQEVRGGLLKTLLKAIDK